MACGLTLAGQAPGVTEFGAGAMASWAAQDFYGGELSLARRPAAGGGQLRFIGSAAGGVVDRGGAAAGAVRLEIGGHFIVNPFARSGVTVYAGLGTAFRGATGNEPSYFLTLTAGIETAAGQRRGWYLETGLGGGAFVRVGYRWRAFPGWWK